MLQERGLIKAASAPIEPVCRELWNGPVLPRKCCSSLSGCLDEAGLSCPDNLSNDVVVPPHPGWHKGQKGINADIWLAM